MVTVHRILASILLTSLTLLRHKLLMVQDMLRRKPMDTSGLTSLTNGGMMPLFVTKSRYVAPSPATLPSAHTACSLSGVVVVMATGLQKHRPENNIVVAMTTGLQKHRPENNGVVVMTRYYKSKYCELKYYQLKLRIIPTMKLGRMTDNVGQGPFCTWTGNFGH